MRARSAKIRSILKLFRKGDKFKIFIVTTTQILLSSLDLLGIGLIGVLGSLGVSGIQSNQPGTRISAVLEFLKISTFSFQFQALFLSLTASLLFIVRTLVSIYLTRRIFHFLAGRAAFFTTGLIRGLFMESPRILEKYKQQEILYATTHGVQNITLGIIGNGISVMSDSALLLVLFGGLLLIDSILAITVIIFFGSLGVILYKFMKVRATNLGISEMEFSIDGNQKIVEYLNSNREAIVKNQREHYINSISKSRFKLAEVLAEKTFLPNISKYIIETAIILGALFVGIIQFAIQDASHAIASLSIFLAAGSRIAPAVLRIQQSSVSIRGSFGASTLTLDLIDSVELRFASIEESPKPDLNYQEFIPEVILKNVNFSYGTNDKSALIGINLSFKPGTFVAIVGPSGSGKSTLVDIILGIYQPNQGFSMISGLNPDEAFKQFPGAVAYVPQSIAIRAGTVRQNICQGYEDNVFSDSEIWKSLKKINLADFVHSLPYGLDTETGDEGFRLSGGEQQRLGIARALISNPKLLILDEASSALDGQTELELSKALTVLRGETTVIVVAHRLSTVRDADQVIYLDKGEVVAIGTFDEVRKAVPDFDSQASLMGL